MKRRTLTLCATLCALVVLSGCGGSVQVPIQKNLRGDAPCAMTMLQMEQSLIAAARNSGWTTRKMGRGSLQAEHRDGSVMAKVAISHTSSRYHITYLDSEGLAYDGTHIGETYNRWLETLKARIALNLPLTCKILPANQTLQAKPAVAPRSVPQQQVQQEISVLTPPKPEAPAEEIEAPFMIESVPTEMMIIR